MQLFPQDDIFPPGFTYEEDFISESQERQLISTISQLRLQTFVFRGYEAKRKVASYGFDYHFDSRSISKGEPVPEGLLWLIAEVAKKLGLPAAAFEEVLVTEYPPGSVINWHRDAPPFGLIAGVSLLSDCTFKLRPYPKELQNRKSLRALQVKARSLYVMKGEAREEWEHSIDKTKSLRYSITLRTLRK